MTDQLVFVDESLRFGRYLLGCVTVPAAKAGELRRSVHYFCCQGSGDCICSGRASADDARSSTR